MSNKLTATQINYLQWTKSGNSIHFCTEVSKQLGEMIYSEALPFETDRRAVFNLHRDGYLSMAEQYCFGIRWAILFISPKGLALLESIDE